ncbi:MAG: hypothetical protein ACTHQ3_04410 [Motilibacteraceae bacterium]
MHDHEHGTGRRTAGRRTEESTDVARRSPALPAARSLAVPVPTLLAAPAQGTDQGLGTAVVRRRADESIVKDWKTESTVKGTFGSKSRSTALKRIDGAVEQWVGLDGFDKDSAYEANLTCIDNIEKQIAKWSTERGGSASSRDASMKDLQDYLAERKKHFTDKKAEAKAAAKERHGVFHTLEPSVAKFAARPAAYSPERFENITADSYADLLSRDRADDSGKLTDEVVQKMVSFDATSGEKEVSISQNAAVTLPPDATAEDIRKLMADPRFTNSVTGKTIFPELENVLAEKEGKAEPVPDETKAFTVGGTTITVTYNPGDVNYQARWGQVQAAVTKVQAAGWTVPPFKLNLPKLGRGIQVTKSAKDCSVQDVGDQSNRAVFWAPDFMHVSSANINNPLDAKSVMDPSAFKFSSTALDPSGVGTIVHELGHMLHFHNDPGKFQGMWGSVFRGEHTDGRAYQEIAVKEVSEYGSKPREMIAEVFLGLVYGKTYSDVVMEMYQSFGGAMPAKAAKAAPAKKRRHHRAKKSGKSKEKGTATAPSQEAVGSGSPSTEDQKATV